MNVDCDNVCTCTQTYSNNNTENKAIVCSIYIKKIKIKKSKIEIKKDKCCVQN